MTEKIIIDGVNVAGCEFLRNCIIPDNYGCKIDDSLCCDVGNCYYKQLKRLEQENKELKKQIESDKGLITLGGKQQYEYLQRIDELEQENETLNYQWHKQSEIGDEWYKVAENYKSALEEIRILATKNVSIENFVKIQNKINEVLK